MTLLDALILKLPSAKRTTLRRMIAAGRVRIDGRVARTAKVEVKSADQVDVLDIPPPPRDGRQARSKGPRLPFEIVHEDADLVVIDKPHGLLTTSGPRDNRPTLLRLLKEHVAAAAKGRAGAELHLVHRLDADAAGLIVFSRNAAAHASLKRQFADHTAERIYLAMVDGRVNPPAGRIRSRLVELVDGRVRSTSRDDRGEMAISFYETLRAPDAAPAGKRRTVVRVRLETGRKHQIRVHLAERGCPICNDPLYNPARPDGPMALVAVELSIDHPRDGRRVTFRRPTPDWAA